MSKLFTTIGCAVALAAFALPANAQTLTVGDSFTASPSNKTCTVHYTTSDQDHTGTISIKSNSTTNVVSEFTLQNSAFIGTGWGDNIFVEFDVVQMTDGDIAYNAQSSMEMNKDFVFTYNGSETITFTFVEGPVDGELYSTPPQEITLDEPFKLGGDNGTKATFIEEMDGDTNKTFEVYLKSSGKSNILSTELKINAASSGSYDYSNGWFAIEMEDGTYAYNGSMNQDETYIFVYTGSDELSFTLGKGVVTEYGIPSELDAFVSVVTPADGNQYALELPTMDFYFADTEIAKVIYGYNGETAIYGQPKVYRGANNVENNDDGESAEFSLGNYNNGVVTPAEGVTGNTVTVDISGYTVNQGEDPNSQGNEGTPVPGIYKVVVPASTVVSTEDGAQNVELSHTVTVLPGLEGTSKVIRGTNGLISGVQVTFPGSSMVENETASLSCTVDGSMVPVSIEGTTVTFNNLEVGQHTLTIPATAYIITNEAGTSDPSDSDNVTGKADEGEDNTSTGNETIENLYLNYEFTLEIEVKGPQTVVDEEEFTLDTNNSIWVYTPVENVPNYYFTCENTNNIFDDDLLIVSSKEDGSMFVMFEPEKTLDGEWVYVAKEGLDAGSSIYFIYNGDETNSITLTLIPDNYISTPVVSLGETFTVSSTDTSYIYINFEEGEYYIESDSKTNLLESGDLEISYYGSDIFTDSDIEVEEGENGLIYKGISFQEGVSYGIQYKGNEEISLTILKGKYSSISAIEKIGDDAVIYNLQGQKVTNPTKGLYIINGKKVILK